MGEWREARFFLSEVLILSTGRSRIVFLILCSPKEAIMLLLEISDKRSSVEDSSDSFVLLLDILQLEHKLMRDVGLGKVSSWSYLTFWIYCCAASKCPLTVSSSAWTWSLARFCSWKLSVSLSRSRLSSSTNLSLDLKVIRKLEITKRSIESVILKRRF